MNRTYPIGYKLVMGEFKEDEKEAPLIRELFDMYLSGRSYKEIAEWISPFFPGENFDKAKIGRILKDKRYLGNEKFPCLISPEVIEEADRLRTGKAEHYLGNRNTEISGLKICVLCPRCRSKMKRKQSENPGKQYWTCSSSTCTAMVRKNDEDFLKELKNILSKLKREGLSHEPDLVKPGYKTTMLERIIKDRIRTGVLDKDETGKDILDLVRMKFEDIPDNGFIRMKISDELDTAGEEDYLEIINKISKAVLLRPDGSLTLVLKDETKVRAGDR
jgi:hypothetical protein